MLAVPTRGVSRSIGTHNVQIDAFSDWIEGSILFDSEQISQTDISDILTEEHIYQDQDFASELISDGWEELTRRQSWLGAAAPYHVDRRRIIRKHSWQEAAAHSFCVLLALASWYRGWIQQFGHDYTEQGELFELLTKESLERQFANWVVHQTGWTRENTAGLASIVDDITGRLGLGKGDFNLWDDPKAKEYGLDLLVYRPFLDNRVGVPVFLMQCASGQNWKHKLKTPDLDVWKDVINFKDMPRRAFSTPFAFLDKEFTQNCVKVQGLLMDRYRILSAGHYTGVGWLSEILKQRIIDWMEPRVEVLPRAEEAW